jgi:hypothetical protein
MRSMRSRKAASAAGSTVMIQRLLRGRSNVVITGWATGASLPAAKLTKVTQGQ